MNRNTRWLTLFGGVFLFVLGIKYIVSSGDWTLMILSVLILAFSISGIIKSKIQD